MRTFERSEKNKEIPHPGVCVQQLTSPDRVSALSSEQLMKVQKAHQLSRRYRVDVSVINLIVKNFLLLVLVVVLKVMFAEHVSQPLTER